MGRADGARRPGSIVNLTLALPLAHRGYVFDNSRDGIDALLYVRCVEGTIRKVYGDLPTWISDALVGIPRHAQFEDLRSQGA